MKTFEIGLWVVRRLCRSSKANLYLFMLTAIILSSATPAQAYIDPGVGGMLVQLLLGGVAGIVVVMRLYWERITSVVRKILRRPDGKTAAPTNGDDADGRAK